MAEHSDNGPPRVYPDAIIPGAEALLVALPPALPGIVPELLGTTPITLPPGLVPGPSVLNPMQGPVLMPVAPMLGMFGGVGPCKIFCSCIAGVSEPPIPGCMCGIMPPGMVPIMPAGWLCV